MKYERRPEPSWIPVAAPHLLLGLLLGLGLLSCRAASTDSPPVITAAPPIKERAKKPAVVFQLAPSPALGRCAPPVLHGLDESGEKLWSKAFLEGELPCDPAETVGLAEVRIEHPHLALRQALRFVSPPTGRVRVAYEFFGDCGIQLEGLDETDLGAHLVIYRVDQESSLEAVFNGRSEILETLEPLRFERLPIGRYALELHREDPWTSRTPYLRQVVNIRPCEERLVELTGS